MVLWEDGYCVSMCINMLVTVPSNAAPEGGAGLSLHISPPPMPPRPFQKGGEWEHARVIAGCIGALADVP